MRLPLPRSPLQVWAVDIDAVQLAWGRLPAGPVSARSGVAETTVLHGGGPGVLLLDGLAPGADHRVEVRWRGGTETLRATTLTPPPGPELCRIATVSDLHLGSTHWGATKTMVDRGDHDVSFPLRCARAAVADAKAWGADLLVVKGDAAHHQDDEHFAQVGDLIDGAGDLPIVLLPGNHDVDGVTTTGDLPTVGRRAIAFERGATSLDLPGVRVVAADSTVPGRGLGSMDRNGAAAVELAAEASGPFLMAIHHHLHPYRVPVNYPIGIRHPESVDFLETLASANTNGLVTSGHTHRNRVRRHRSLLVTEVASTRDWPGVWAGYVVHEGGIRQTIRRSSTPEAAAWHEYSRGALLGWWGRWAAGPLDHRCLVHTWD